MERTNDTHETQAEQVRALSPQEIMELKHEMMPPAVLEIVNRLLAENVNQAGYATIKQEDIVKELIASGLKRREIFDKHWLDFEDQYREAGWEVTHNSPSYDETFDAYFRFSLPDRRTLGATAVRRSVRRS